MTLCNPYHMHASTDFRHLWMLHVRFGLSGLFVMFRYADLVLTQPRHTLHICFISRTPCTRCIRVLCETSTVHRSALAYMQSALRHSFSPEENDPLHTFPLLIAASLQCSFIITDYTSQTRNGCMDLVLQGLPHCTSIVLLSTHWFNT